MNQKPPIDLNAALAQRMWLTPEEHEYRKQSHVSCSFAAGMNLYKVIWVFFLCSFLGVAFESLLRLFATGDWVRTSGMLYGPFNQVYGFGGVVFTLVLYRLRYYNAFFTFVVGTLLGLCVEYMASLLQEVMFKSQSWDYSKMPFNLDGRTNLLYGIGWGILAVVFMHFVYPLLSNLVERLPNRVGKIITLALAVLLCLDMAISGLAVSRWGQRDAGVQAKDSFAVWLDETYPDSRMEKAYPALEFKR